jgi:hypothetical protein
MRYVWAFPNTAIGLVLLPFALLTRGRAQIVDGVLEIYGGFLSSALGYIPIVGGAAAMTLGHVVIARDRRSLMFTRRHERVHVRQCEVWGPAFIPAYFMAALWGLMTGAGGYHGNYFEREAMLAAGARNLDSGFKG